MSNNQLGDKTLLSIEHITWALRLRFLQKLFMPAERAGNFLKTVEKQFAKKKRRKRECNTIQNICSINKDVEVAKEHIAIISEL